MILLGYICQSCQKKLFDGKRCRKYCDDCRSERNKTFARERYRAIDPDGTKLASRIEKQYWHRERGNHWTAHYKNPKDHICVECGSMFQSFQRKASICKNPQCISARRAKIAKKGGGSRQRKFATDADRHKFYLYKRRAIVAQQKIGKFSAEEIFERDNWTCGICSFAVDESLKYPHSYSATLDHIIPVSLGGGHIRENVQCSHWICNMRKGKRTKAA